MLKKLLLSLLVLVVAAAVFLPIVRSDETSSLSADVRLQTSGSFITTPMGTTHYESMGAESGEPVVLVHGFASPYYVWDSVTPALAAAGYRVIRFDLMGRGYSDRPDVEYNASYLARQVNELLNGLGIAKPVNIVGYSMGGVVAAEFVNQHPERVKKVALVAPFNTAKSVGPLAWPVVGDWLAKVVLAPGMPNRQSLNFYRPENFPLAADQFREQMQFKGFARAIHSSLKTIITADQLPRYEKLASHKKDMLLIWGKEDQVVPFAESGRVRQALANVAFLPVAESGHAPQSEHPVVVNAALLKWLAK